MTYRFLIWRWLCGQCCHPGSAGAGKALPGAWARSPEWGWRRPGSHEPRQGVSQAPGPGPSPQPAPPWPASGQSGSPGGLKPGPGPLHEASGRKGGREGPAGTRWACLLFVPRFRSSHGPSCPPPTFSAFGVLQGQGSSPLTQQHGCTLVRLLSRPAGSSWRPPPAPRTPSHCRSPQFPSGPQKARFPGATLALGPPPRLRTPRGQNPKAPTGGLPLLGGWCGHAWGHLSLSAGFHLASSQPWKAGTFVRPTQAVTWPYPCKVPGQSHTQARCQSVPCAASGQEGGDEAR